MDTLIKFAPDTVVLFGRDEPKNDTMPTIDYTRARMMKGPKDEITVPGFFDYQGSLRTMYRFVEKYCDFHIMGPLELNFVYSPSKTLVVKGTEDRHRSSLQTKQGSAAYGENIAVWGGKEDSQNRILYQRRMRWGGKPWYINHTFEHMKYKLRFITPVKPTDENAKDYREKLRRYEEGIKVFEHDIPEVSDKNRANQFCFSSRTMIEQVAQDARDFFDGKIGNKGDKYMKELAGRADVFAVVPLDVGGYCKCDKCKPLQNAGLGREGYGFNSGRYSDYVFSFVNSVAREVAKTHPDKYIGTLAYEQYYWMPERLKMEKNVVIAPCMHPMYWERSPAVRNNEEGWYKKWLQESKKGNMGPLYMWNYDFPVTYQVYYGVSRGKMVKRWLDDGIQAIFHCGSPEPVGMYVTSKLYEDKNLDPKQLVDEYFELYFGPASKPMHAFYDELVDLTSNTSNYPLAKRGGYIHIRLAEPNFVFTDKRVKKLRDLMNQAKELGKDDPYKSRIAAWDKMIIQQIEKDVYSYQGKKATDYAARIKKMQGQKQTDGFISSITSYPGDYWYARRKPIALVDASDMTESETGVFGTKDAIFKPKSNGFYWPSYFPDQGAWFMFDLGGVYELDQMHVWNYNDKDGNTDWGLKDVTIAYAPNKKALYNDKWIELPPMQFNQASKDGKAGADNVIDFGGKKVRYVYIHAKGPQGKANWRMPKDALNGEKRMMTTTGKNDYNAILPDAKIGLGKVRFYGSPKQLPMPVLSFVDDNLRLKLGLSVPGIDDAKIHYTIDGSMPDKSSPLYSKPFAIANDVVLRAKAYAPGKLPSDHAPMKINYNSAYKTLIESFEVARGKPVTASGSESPQRDVKFMNDGKEGKDSSWWSAGNPRWGKIDLGKPVKIGQIWVQTWWDDTPNGRACKYTVEVSADGKDWKQVIDWSKNKTPSTASGDLHRFEPVTARYIKINNLPWLCEIKVYKIP